MAQDWVEDYLGCSKQVINTLNTFILKGYTHVNIYCRLEKIQIQPFSIEYLVRDKEGCHLVSAQTFLFQLQL